MAGSVVKRHIALLLPMAILRKPLETLTNIEIKADEVYLSHTTWHGRQGRMYVSVTSQFVTTNNPNQRWWRFSKRNNRDELATMRGQV